MVQILKFEVSKGFPVPDTDSDPGETKSHPVVDTISNLKSALGE